VSSYTDDISQQWFDLAFAVTRQKRLSLREKELVILAVLSQYDAPYLRYAHSEIAVCIGFSKDQVQDAFHGKLPGGLSERESTVFDLALNVTKLKHPMDDETFEKARVSLTRDEIAGVAHIVSGYIYVAILANIGNGYVPKAQEGMFQASKNPSL
jgi:alkylhydroperoxidase/carboxymuconolactone decarboxylase family protein YurZ